MKIYCFNEDSGDAVFSYNQMVIFCIDLDNINLGNNFNEDDPDASILAQLLA